MANFGHRNSVFTLYHHPILSARSEHLNSCWIWVKQPLNLTKGQVPKGCSLSSNPAIYLQNFPVMVGWLVVVPSPHYLGLFQKQTPSTPATQQISCQDPGSSRQVTKSGWFFTLSTCNTASLAPTAAIIPKNFRRSRSQRSIQDTTFARLKPLRLKWFSFKNQAGWKSGYWKTN